MRREDMTVLRREGMSVSVARLQSEDSVGCGSCVVCSSIRISEDLEVEKMRTLYLASGRYELKDAVDL
jgi:hypothetical protein